MNPDPNTPTQSAPPTTPQAGPWRALWSLAWPIMLSNACFGMRTSIDAAMIGNLSTNHLAAIGPAQYVLLVFQVFGAGMFYALAPMVASLRERGRFREAGSATWNAIWIAVILGLAFLVSFFAVNVFQLLGHDPAVQALQVTYFQNALWSLPAFYLVQVLINFYCAVEESRTTILASAAYLVSGVALNVWLIPTHGMAGAAWSLTVSTILWATGLVITFWIGSTGRRYRSQLGFRRRPFTQILGKGVFYGAADIADLVFWNIALLVIIGQHGTIHLAAATILIVLLDLIIIPAEGVGVAIATRISTSLTAGNPAAAKRDLSIGTRMNLIIMIPYGLVIAFGASLILPVFGASPVVMAAARPCLILFPLILLAEALVLGYNNGLGGAEEAKAPFLIFLFANLTVILGLGTLINYIMPIRHGWVGWLIILINRSVIAVALAMRWHKSMIDPSQ